MRNMIVNSVTPLPWSPLYSKVEIRQCVTQTHMPDWLDCHLVSEKPWNHPKSLNHTFTEDHPSIRREEVSIATPHPSSRSMSLGTRCQERVWHCNFSFTKHTLWDFLLKHLTYHEDMQFLPASQTDISKTMGKYDNSNVSFIINFEFIIKMQ